MRKFHAICAVVGMLFVIGGTAMAATAPTVITELLPQSASPVAGSWYLSDVRTGATASIVDLSGLGGNLENNQPLPPGAAKLTTDFTNAAKAEVGTFGDFGLASAVLNDIVLGYSYYKQNVSGGNAFAAPSMKLTISASGGTGDNYGSLVYEPYWNQADGSMNLQTNVWQSVSINSSTGAGPNLNYGGWWWDGGFEIASGFGGPPIRSLSEWVTAFQASDPTDFASARVVALSMGVGTYNQGQIGYFDKVSIQSTAGSVDAVYDFQPAPPEWKGPGGGSYHLASNWTNNSVPNGVDATANFLGKITEPSVVTLISDVTVGTINFDSLLSYSLEGTSNLILQTSSGNASINVQAGSHEISAPVVLQSDTLISGAGTLDISGGITGSYVLEVDNNLTAASIQVDTLIIGSEANHNLNSAAGGSNHAVPEPSALVLLGLAATSLLFYRGRHGLR